MILLDFADRQRMGEFFMMVCEHHGIPMPAKKLFKDMQLFDFMYKQVRHISLLIELFDGLIHLSASSAAKAK